MIQAEVVSMKGVVQALEQASLQVDKTRDYMSLKEPESHVREVVELHGRMQELTSLLRGERPLDENVLEPLELEKERKTYAPVVVMDVIGLFNERRRIATSEVEQVIRLRLPNKCTDARAWHQETQLYLGLLMRKGVIEKVSKGKYCLAREKTDDNDDVVGELFQ